MIESENPFFVIVQVHQSHEILLQITRLTILRTSLISSIHENLTLSDKVLNKKSKVLSEILIIFVTKPEQNYSLFTVYTTQTVMCHMELKLNACTFW